MKRQMRDSPMRNLEKIRRHPYGPNLGVSYVKRQAQLHIFLTERQI